MWIESHVEIGDHPKTQELAELLGIEVAQAVGHLHLLWHFTLKFSPNGDLIKFSDSVIAKGVKWPGESQQFINALKKAGWLDDQKCVHDWDDYAGRYIHERNRRRRFNKKKNRVAKQETFHKRSENVLRTSHKTFPVTSDHTLPTIPTRHNQPKDLLVPSQDALGLAERLRVLILENNPKAKVPKDLRSWASEADRMMRLDERAKEDIERVMNFSQTDPFWKANILSMSKLREKFDQLWMKLNAGGPDGKANGRVTGYAAPTPGKYADTRNDGERSNRDL